MNKQKKKTKTRFDVTKKTKLRPFGIMF